MPRNRIGTGDSMWKGVKDWDNGREIEIETIASGTEFGKSYLVDKQDHTPTAVITEQKHFPGTQDSEILQELDEFCTEFSNEVKKHRGFTGGEMSGIHQQELVGSRSVAV